MTEEWRPVVGWEEHYEVSNLGRLRRLPNVVKCFTATKTLKHALVPGTITNAGYRRVTLHAGGAKRALFIHMLVAQAFLGRTPYGKQTVNHINGNRQDNRLCNLEWLSRADNTRHSWEMRA